MGSNELVKSTAVGQPWRNMASCVIKTKKLEWKQSKSTPIHVAGFYNSNVIEVCRGEIAK